MTPKITGGILMLIGIIYLIRPNIFRIGFWKKTDVAQQIFSPKQYIIYMRVIGTLVILWGLYYIIKK
jgi:hypothetical protein